MRNYDGKNQMSNGKKMKRKSRKAIKSINQIFAIRFDISYYCLLFWDFIDCLVGNFCVGKF
jgi:hypothetical protein